MLIYGFGRTEDVPIGESAAVVAGFDDAELGAPCLCGYQLLAGPVCPASHSSAILYGLVNVGGYLREGEV